MTFSFKPIKNCFIPRWTKLNSNRRHWHITPPLTQLPTWSGPSKLETALKYIPFILIRSFALLTHFVCEGLRALSYYRFLPLLTKLSSNRRERPISSTQLYHHWRPQPAKAGHNFLFLFSPKNSVTRCWNKK